MLSSNDNIFQLKPLYISLLKIDDELKTLVPSSDSKNSYIIPPSKDQNVKSLIPSIDSNSQLATCYNGSIHSSSATNLNKKNKGTREACYACPYKGCSKFFGKASRLIVHERIHTGARPFICHYDGCDKTYTRRFHLTRHVNISHGVDCAKAREEEFRCYVCEKLFSNCHSLKKHVKILHSVKRYRCFECGQDFRKQHCLKSHTFIHTGIKPYRCEFPNCGAEFVHLVHFKRHGNQHRKDRYACSYPECTVKMDAYSELLKHLATSHPKNCAECGKKFDQLAKLRRHLLTHTNIREAYFCPFTPCERYYLEEKNLHSHIRSKHDENFKGFQCPICDKFLVTKQRLKHHLITHDPMKHYQKPKPRAPRKPRKDKGVPKPKDFAKLLSGYSSGEEEAPFYVDCRDVPNGGQGDSVSFSEIS